MNPLHSCPGCGTSLDVNPARCHWDQEKRQTICGDCHEHRKEILDMTEKKSEPKPAAKKARPKIRYHLIENGDEDRKLIVASADDPDALLAKATQDQALAFYQKKLVMYRGWLEPANVRLTAR